MCNVILADDAGLNKSISALAAVIEYKQYWPLLILTSTSKKEQWVELVKSRVSSVSVMVLESSKNLSRNNGDEQ
jgi:SNF2 family DNA or RNA helicase